MGSIQKDINTDNLEKELLSFNCPQNWSFSFPIEVQKCKQKIRVKMSEGNSEMSCDSDHATTERFIHYLILSYFKYLNSDYEDALNLLVQCFPLIDDPDYMIKKYSKAFMHVLNASQAHVIYKIGDYNLVTNIIDHIKSEEYSSYDESGMLCIQAYFFLEFGEEGNKHSLKTIRTAIKLNSTEVEFHFMLGLMMARERNRKRDLYRPSPMEILHLKHAHTANPRSPSYAVILARVYSDLAAATNKPSEKSQYSLLSENIIMKLLEDKGENLNGRVIARCFFLMLRRQDIVYENWEHFVNLALEKSPLCVMVNHYSGLFYLHSKQIEKGLKYLSFALTTLPYVMCQVLYLKHLQNSLEDIDNFIKETLENYTNSKDVSFVYYGVSEFYLMIHYDLLKAAHYYNLAPEKSNSELKYFMGLCKHKHILYVELLKNELESCSSDLQDSEEIKRALSFLTVSPKTKYTWLVSSLKQFIF